MRTRPLKPPFRVLIVDDHRFIGEILGQRLALDRALEITGVVVTGIAAEDLVLKREIDIVLLDMELEQDDGLRVARALLEQNPALRIIGLSMHDRDHYPLALLKLGAAGFLSKRTSAREVADGIRRVASGEMAVSPLVAAHLATHSAGPGPLELVARLTGKEAEVLTLLARGESIKSISGLMGLNAKTVQTHRNNLRKKLGVTTDVELCLLAIKAGLLDVHRVALRGR